MFLPPRDWNQNEGKAKQEQDRYDQMWKKDHDER